MSLCDMIKKKKMGIENLQYWQVKDEHLKDKQIMYSWWCTQSYHYDMQNKQRSYPL